MAGAEPGEAGEASEPDAEPDPDRTMASGGEPGDVDEARESDAEPDLD